MCAIKQYPIYWCKVKKKVRPCVVVERGIEKVRVMFISSSLESDYIIEFENKNRKQYKGYLHKELKIIDIKQLIRFIGMTEI